MSGRECWAPLGGVRQLFALPVGTHKQRNDKNTSWTETRYVLYDKKKWSGLVLLAANKHVCLSPTEVPGSSIGRLIKKFWKITYVTAKNIPLLDNYR